MARSTLFVLIILVLCFVALCSNADVSLSDAKDSVKEAKNFTEKVLDKVTKKVSYAVELKKNIDKQKGNAEKAATEAEKTANGNKTAEAIAQKVRKASDEVVNHHSNASVAAQSIVEKMNELLAKALELKKKANTLSVGGHLNNNYTKIKEDADDIKSQADTLDEEVTKAASSFGSLRIQEDNMLQLVSDTHLAKYYVEVAVALAKIDTVLKSADDDIKRIEDKRDEIAVTEKEMKNIFDNRPHDLTSFFLSLYLSVQGDLLSASRRIDDAKQAKTRILELKERVNSALEKIKADNNEYKASLMVFSVRSDVENAENILEDTQNAVESATTSAIAAVLRKNAAENVLKERAEKQYVTQNNKKTNPPDYTNNHQPVQNTTESLAGSETKKEQIPIPLKPVSVKPKKDTKEKEAGIEEKKPKITTQDKPVGEQPLDEATESPEENETEKPTIKNSEQPVSEGTEPTKPFSSESAMTVSVPLLLAMVAWAALH